MSPQARACAPSATLRRPAMQSRRKWKSNHGRALREMASNNAQYRPLRALFPFNFRKCCGCVARVVVVEQLPSRSLGSRGGIGGNRDWLAARDQRFEHPTPVFRGSAVHRRAPPASRSRRRDPEPRVAPGGALSSSMTVSQPRMLPSMTGICSRNTRSPANRVPVCSSSTVRSLSLCAAGHALSARVREPRSRLSVPSTSSVGGTMRTSSIN